MVGAALAAGMLWAAPAGIAAAAITITVPNVTAPESSSTQTGFFDVFVAASGNSLPEVGDFTVDLQISPTSSVDFTGGAATTADPYIFAGQSSGPTVQLSNSDTTIEASDFASSPPTLANGDGLLAVDYSIPANTSGTFNLTLVTTGQTPTALDDQNGNPIAFTVQNATLTVVPSTVYWNGDIDSNWNTLSGASYATNWSVTSSGFTDAHALPGATTDVNFNSSGSSTLSTTLGANFSIKGLTFMSAETRPVTISGNTLTLGADGLDTQSSSAAATINSAVTLSTSQTWTLASSNPLTINGTLSLAGQTLTKAGAGTLQVDSAPSLASGSTLAITAGTVQIDNSSAATTVGTNVSVSVAPAATLQLAGSASALSAGSNAANIVNDGAIASGGELLVTGTNQVVGSITGQGGNGSVASFSGDTVVGNGATGASLSTTQILQNSLIVNADSIVTIEPTGSLPSSGVVAAGSAAATNSTTTSATTLATSAASAASPAITTTVSSGPFLSVQSAIPASSTPATSSAASSASASTASAAASAAASVAASPAAAATTSASTPTSAVAAADPATAGVQPTSVAAAVIATASTAAMLPSSVSSVVATPMIANDAASLMLGSPDVLALAPSAIAATPLDFSAVATASDDVSVVPEPSGIALLLLAVGISGAAWLARRRKSATLPTT